MISCRYCGANNLSDATNCRVCGSPLGKTVLPTALPPQAASSAAVEMPISGGKTLAQLARERGGQLSEREAVTYILRAAQALDEWHRRGIFHGGVSLQSIVIGPSGQVMLTNAASITGAPELTAQRDLHSLAVTLISLLVRHEVMPAQYAHTLVTLQGNLPLAGALRSVLVPPIPDRLPSLQEWIIMLDKALHARMTPAGKPVIPSDTKPPASVPVAPTPAPMAPAPVALQPRMPTPPAPIPQPMQRPAPPRTAPAQPAPPIPIESLTLVPLRRIPLSEGRFTTVAFGSEGKEIWSGTEDGVVQIWSAITGTCLAKMDTRFRGGGTVTSLAFAVEAGLTQTPSGAPKQDESIASGHEDGRIRLWDARANKMQRVLDAHEGRVECLDFAPSFVRGLNLASGGSDGTLQIWDVADGQRLHTLREDASRVKVVAASPNGQDAAIGGDAGCLEVWRISAQRQLWSNSMHEFWLTSLAFSPNGKMLASGGYDRTIRLWGVDSSNEFKTLTEHTASIMSLTFSPDNRLLASASSDGTVRLWDALKGIAGPVLNDLGGAVNSVAWSPGGRVLATAADSAILLWKLEA